jgi:hypothetical protein
MFFADPVAAFTNIGRSVRPSGRLAMLTWQALDRNAWVLEMREALSLGRPLPPEGPGPGPFSLAEPDIVRDILERAGWTDVDFEAIEEPMNFGETANAAFELMRDIGLVRGLAAALQFSDAERQQALDRLYETMRRHQTTGGVLIESQAWVITARRGF